MSMIIIGGGMAGATLALAVSHLTHGRLPVTLVEARQPAGQSHPGYDARAIALSAGTCQQLSAAGIWPLLQECVTPIRHVHVSDQGHAAFVSMRATDYALPALGYVIELHDAGARLYRKLKQAPGITLHCPSTAVRVERTARAVNVMLDNGAQISGQLLVAADGTRSPIGRYCGQQWHCDDYQQVAIIANVSMQQHHNGQAFERFTPAGPLALLPMSQRRSSLVWCHPPSAQTSMMHCDDDTFLAELQRAFGWRLGKFIRVGQRGCYPLALHTASQPVSHRLVLVGNAAQTLHPIAGQGFNLGLRDVMSLAESTALAYQQQQDIGGFRVLECYRARRATDRRKSIHLTDGLVHLFANNYSPLIVGRDLGLMAMDLLPSLRNKLAARTLGWVTR